MIRITQENGLRQRISIGDHTLHSDVPQELGGAGSAPEPHDLFDSALGACKALTLALYARQKGLPLDSVDVSISRDDSEERLGNYQLIVTLGLNGALDENQRQQLLRVADKCPVHKLMTTTDIQITTQLSEPQDD